jgi:hypothetical protein
METPGCQTFSMKRRLPISAFLGERRSASITDGFWNMPEMLPPAFPANAGIGSRRLKKKSKRTKN